MRRLPLLLVVLLAGCVGDESPPDPAPPAPQPPEPIPSVAVDARAFPEGVDWVAFRSPVPPTGDLTLRTSLLMVYGPVEQGPRASTFCAMTAAGGLGPTQAVLDTDRMRAHPAAGVSSSFTPSASLTPGIVHAEFHSIEILPPPDGPAWAVVGADAASRARLESLAFEVESEGARWEPAGSGRLHCVATFEDYDEGTFGRAEGGASAVDLRASRTVERGGALWLNLAGDLGWAATVTSPGGRTWETRADPQVGGAAERVVLCDAAPGAWEIRVEKIGGTRAAPARAEFVLVDVAAEAHAAFACA